MVIKNIFWDWNGTLVDDAYLFVEIMNVTLLKHGLPQISIKEYKKSFCFPIQKYWQGLGFQFNKQQFQKMNVEFIKLYQSKMKEPLLQEGALKILAFAQKRSIKQFVLSASEHKMLNELVQFYRIKNYFADVVGVNNLNATGKVDLALFLIKKYNLNPMETVVIGDTLYDKQVANTIGSNLFLLGCGHFHKDRLLSESIVVDQLVDLMPLIL